MYTVWFVSMVLLILAFAPIAILINSIPEPMINWLVMYSGGAVHLVGLFGLIFMANWKYLFKKKEE